MKKFVSLLLTFIMILSFTACKSGPSSEEISAATEIVNKLDLVFNTHHSANKDVMTANAVSAASGCATRMVDLTSQLEYMSHDEFVEALASIVALMAEDQGNDDPGAIYEWCVTMDDPSDMFYIFNEAYVPKACGMAIQGHAYALSGTDDVLEEAISDMHAFSQTYPDSEMLASLEYYCDAVATYSEYCQSAFVITDSVLIEIESLEDICKSARRSI